MRLASISLALIAGLSFGGVARAATVNALKGQVLVNTGQGYRLVDGTIELEAGATVVANPGAIARVVYGGRCTVTVRPGSVYQIAPGVPCRAGQPTQSAAVADAGGSSGASQSGSNAAVWFLGGAALVAGGVAIYSLTPPQSP